MKHVLESAVPGNDSGAGGAPSGIAQGAASLGNGPQSASGRIKVAEKDYDEESGTFSIVFTDGAQSEVELDSLPSHIVRILALHGLSQKLGDSYASVKGNVVEAKEKYEAVLNQLRAGDWKKSRAEGEGTSRVTELAAAIARLRNAPVEKANALIAAASAEQKKAWQGNAQVKALIAVIRAEKAQAKAEKAQAAAGDQPDALAGLPTFEGEAQSDTLQ
jgi:hypothetical protein